MWGTVMVIVHYNSNLIQKENHNRSQETWKQEAFHITDARLEEAHAMSVTQIWWYAAFVVSVIMWNRAALKITPTFYFFVLLFFECRMMTKWTVKQWNGSKVESKWNTKHTDATLNKRFNGYINGCTINKQWEYNRNCKN